ncbi:hotdog fold thioesterase [Lentzea sp. NPDC059081]|uniref:hotdog fold thioesterase n=1 Tax=Lentzea sp. NPDC059081 TaxID=3346719 RepID=UPI0036B4718A
MITKSNDAVGDPAAAERGILDQQLAAKMGIVFELQSPELVVATMPVAGNLQPFGLLHGGANAVLAESVGSVAAFLNSRGHGIAGQELSCSHHRPALSGRVTAVCTPVHIGRTSSSFDVVITDDQGRRTCTARLTCAVLVPRAKTSDSCEFRNYLRVS